MTLASSFRRVVDAARYVVSHRGTRDPSVWVFGNRKGFTDNPRYLAEHLMQRGDELKPCWIARTASEAAAARSAGVAAVLWDSDEAIRVQRSAGVAFLTNGFQDLQVPHLGGAFLVHLYHGTPIKRVNLDANFTRTSTSRLVRALPRLYRWSLAVGAGQIDLFVAPGELARVRFQSAFGVRSDRIAVLGTPRFDVIQGGAAYDRVMAGDLRHRLGIDQDERLVLWLPTWREHGRASWLPMLHPNDLDAYLAPSGSTLLLKPHPRTDVAALMERLPAHHTRLRVLTDLTLDPNCLMRESNALVTDYSSAAFDYAILGRPLYFFTPDISAYAEDTGFYQPMADLTGGRHHTEWRSLLSALGEDGAAPDSPGMVTATAVGSLSGNRDQPGSSERIAAHVAALVGIGAASNAPS